MEWPYFEPLHYMCSNDRNSARPWWKHSIIVYEKNLYSCHSPSHRICLHGMEWRTDSKTPALTRLIFEKTWNNASSPPEEIRLAHSCASLQNTWKVSSRSFVLINCFPPSYRAHLAIRSESTPIPSPLQKRTATLNTFLPRAMILWNTLPFDVQSSTVSF